MASKKSFKDIEWPPQPLENKGQEQTTNDAALAAAQKTYLEKRRGKTALQLMVASEAARVSGQPLPTNPVPHIASAEHSEQQLEPAADI